MEFNTWFNLPAPDSSGFRQKLFYWYQSLFMAVLAIYFYVFMEWLFLVTKPSFMDIMNWSQKASVLLVSGLLISFVCLPLLLVLLGLIYISGPSRIWKVFILLGLFLPALFLSFTSLLLIDNFTYTLFKFGIVSTQGIFRGLYGLLFLAILFLWYRWLLHRPVFVVETPKLVPSVRRQSALFGALLVVSLVVFFPKLQIADRSLSQDYGNLTRRPNIILLGGDGISADKMSVYGYERDTTPFLRDLANSSLLAENAFTNAGNTTGSLISLLTGKLPTETHVIYPPNILSGAAAYQHLPGILRSEGYRTIQITFPYYIDAYTQNMLDSFDMVNKKLYDQSGFYVFTKFPALQDTGYFFSVLVERLSDRLLHIFYIKQMDNPYKKLTNDQVDMTDQERIALLLKNLQDSRQPVFAHVHLMVTHGEKFHPRKRVFSAGEAQDKSWMPDFYDDAVLDFDAYVDRVVNQLDEMGLLDNTIVVVMTDHARSWRTNERIPLIIHFPHGEYAGRIHNNVQNLDIAPTLLDYLGLSIPDWMEGQSLLAGEPDPYRPIYSTFVSYNVQVEEGEWVVDESLIKPPFYQFGYLQEIICQNLYYLDLRQYDWKVSTIDSQTTPCSPDGFPDTQTVQAQMVAQLERGGFDTTDLKAYLSSLQVSSPGQ